MVFKNSVRAQLFFMFLIASALPMAVVYFAIFSGLNHKTVEDNVEHLKTISYMQATRLDDILSRFEMTTCALSDHEDLRNAVEKTLKSGSESSLKSQLRRTLRSLSASTTMVKQIDIYSPEREHLIGFRKDSDEPLEAPSSIKNYKLTYNLELFRLPALDRENLAYIAELPLSEGNTAYMVVTFSVRTIREMVNSHIGQGQTGETLIFANASEDRPEALFLPSRFKNKGKGNEQEFLQTVEANLESDGQVQPFMAKDYRGQRVRAAGTQSADRKFTVIAKIDDNEILAAARLFQIEFFLVILCLILLAFVGAYYFSQPIRNLSQIAYRFTNAQKNRLHNGAKGNSEVPLDEALNLAIEGTHEFIDELKTEVDEKDKQLQTIKEYQKQLAEIVETSTDAIVSTNSLGVIETWNQGAENLFGYTKREAIGMNVQELIPEDGKLDWVERARVFKGERVQNMATVRLHKDGQRINVSVSLSPFFNKEGQVRGVVAIARDMEKLLEKDRILRRYAMELENKNNEVRKLLYTISHDLKSPLVTAISFLQFAREDLTQGRSKESLDSLSRVQNAVEKMRLLTSDILEINRYGHVDLTEEWVDIDEMVKEIVHLYAADLAAISGVINVATNLPRIYGDRVSLSRVFENLINNSIKYYDKAEPLVIDVFSEYRGAEELIIVRDNGRGIDKKYAKIVFEPFQRLTSKPFGSGVGLAIVAKIMNLHGGEAWVESDVGSNASFILKFPKERIDTFQTKGEVASLTIGK